MDESWRPIPRDELIHVLGNRDTENLLSNTGGLYCYREAGFEQERRSLEADLDRGEAILSLATTPRLCAHFLAYLAGFTPKQHLEIWREEEGRRQAGWDATRQTVLGAVVGAVVAIVSAALSKLL